MALEATAQYGALHHHPLNSATQYILQEVRISRPLVLSADTSPEVSLVLRPREEGSRTFSKSWMELRFLHGHQRTDGQSTAKVSSLYTKMTKTQSHQW